MIKYLKKKLMISCPHCHKHFFKLKKENHQIMIKNKHYRYVCHKCATLKLEEKVG